MALHGRGRVQGVAHSQAKYHGIGIVQSSLAPDLVSNELRMLQLQNLELHLYHVHDLDPLQLGEVLEQVLFRRALVAAVGLLHQERHLAVATVETEVDGGREMNRRQDSDFMLDHAGVRKDSRPMAIIDEL